MVLNEKVFSKKHDFEEKTVFEKHGFQWKGFCKKHAIELKIFRPVRFWKKNFTTCQILNQLFYHV